MISGTQPAGCSPISESFASGNDIRPVELPHTVAESLAIGDPASGSDAIGVIRESGGYADAPQDDEIVAAQLLLARSEGIFTEPAGGTVIASLRRKIDDGTVAADETVVCLITGNGLKVPSHLARGIRSHAVGSTLPEVEQIFGQAK
jgi:threonine synthase